MKINDRECFVERACDLLMADASLVEPLEGWIVEWLTDHGASPTNPS